VASHEVDICLGTSLPEIFRLLGELPPDVVLSDHFGDADLSLIFRDLPPPRTGTPPDSH
jgi:uncharacterized repeat protein (TIGR03917 family)